MDKQSASSFAKLQQEMSDYIYLMDEPKDLSSWRCSDRIPQEIALGIYQNNLHGGVSQHLQTHFPTAQRYVGDQGYRFISAEYLKASPPEQPLFTLYAAHFPGFLVEYGEKHPQQAIWPVAARLAQIDFFHQNTFCEDQRIEVEAQLYELWLTLNTIIVDPSSDPSIALYHRPELHPENYSLPSSDVITLVTFWHNDDLFFRVL